MKQRVLFVIWVIILSGCVEKPEDVGIAEVGNTSLKGRVVEGTSHSALPNIMVLVTNGSQTYGMTSTSKEGYFELEVNYNKIDTTYYLLLDGGSDEVRKKEELRGVAVEEYDYGDIVLFSLPSFHYGGRTYQVAPEPKNEMTWDNANAYCNALTLYNHSDWRLPTKEELIQVYVERSAIGGFSYQNYWSSDRTDDYYTGYSYYHDYYYFNFRTAEIYNMSGANRAGVRPIRKMN